MLTLHNSHSIRSFVKRYFLKDLSIFFILGDDINLNSTVFHWPDQIEIIFDKGRDQLYNSRNHAEMVLLERYSVKTFSFTDYFQRKEKSHYHEEGVNVKEGKLGRQLRKNPGFLLRRFQKNTVDEGGLEYSVA